MIQGASDQLAVTRRSHARALGRKANDHGAAGRRGDRARSDEASAREANERYPADPRRIFARHLRAFLDDTADADFSVRTISLTGGADGIEFVDPWPRQKPVMWQLAVIAGPEATAAARAAAEAWLKEIEP
ncbi:MAG: hypothetical protein AB7Q16_25745 [Vicinamibacterales bacterium]